MSQLISKRLPQLDERRADGSAVYRPTYIVWEITLHCDQACKFCGTRAGHARAMELSTAECLDVVSQVAQMGAKEVALHGGEAYLRPDWLEIVRAVHDHGMDCTMVTGGRNFTSKLAMAAKAAGMSAVSVSIDGTEATHDMLRSSKGSHAAALKTLSYLNDAGIRAGCNTQLNRRNYAELRQIAELIVPYKPYGWQVQLMVPMGRAADAEDLWLQPYDLLDLIPKMAEVRSYCDSVGLKLWPGDNVGYFGPHEHDLRKDRTRSGHSGGCGGGVITLGIEAHGDIKGCSAMSSEGYVGGNVRTHGLQEVWDEAPELRFSRDFKVDDLWGYCKTCYYSEICKAGCIWTASTIMGRRGNNPYCHHRALEMLAAGKRERLERVQLASGAIRDRARFEIIEEDAPPEWVKNIARTP